MLLDPEDGDDTVLRNVGNRLQNYTTSQPLGSQLMFLMFFSSFINHPNTGIDPVAETLCISVISETVGTTQHHDVLATLS